MISSRIAFGEYLLLLELQKKIINMKDVILILSSGGARGLAQIGVIEELEEAGYNIKAVAGSSIGALIGGFYAAGKLIEFKEWVQKLDRIDVMKYFDVALNSRGFIKGQKIMKELRSVVGDHNIEDFSILFKAISSDITDHKEVVFDKGDLFDAIRASISIPGVFTPFEHNSNMLVDGAICNPMPMDAFERKENDMMIAVNLNARIPFEAPEMPKELEEDRERLMKVFYQWKDKAAKVLNVKKQKPDKKPGLYGVLFRSFEVMQESFTYELVHRYKPNMLIELSRESADTFEFNKATELIAYGRQQTRKALNS